MTISLDAEQLAVVAHDPFAEGNLKVNAGAGCGKTTTMVAVANRWSDKKILYITFNKDMILEAEKKMPENVECRTGHSLAYAIFGKMLRAKLSRGNGVYKNQCSSASEIAKHFKLKDLNLGNGVFITSRAIGETIKRTVNNFEYSAERQIEHKHVDVSLVQRHIDSGTLDVGKWQGTIVSYAQELWERRIDPSCDTLCGHDTYFKLWHLSNPTFDGFDLILLDEAQDTNDCMLDVLKRCGKPLVFVGDIFQQLYSWRGSVNALGKMETPTMLPLSTSFRFGKNVAKAANDILNACKVEKIDFTLKGCGVESLVGTKVSFGDAPYTKIFRTNGALIQEAVDKMSEGVPVYINIDTKDAVSMLYSLIALRTGKMEKVTHGSVIAYSSWKDLDEDIEHGTVQPDVARFATMVTRGTASKTITLLSRYTKPERASVTLTTAHKAKGLEWDNVWIAEDFRDMEEDAAERNLWYVAVTRAKKRLRLSKQMNDFLYGEKENG